MSLALIQSRFAETAAMLANKRAAWRDDGSHLAQVWVADDPAAVRYSFDLGFVVFGTQFCDSGVCLLEQPLLVFSFWRLQALRPSAP